VDELHPDGARALRHPDHAEHVDVAPAKGNAKGERK